MSIALRLVIIGLILCVPGGLVLGQTPCDPGSTCDVTDNSGSIMRAPTRVFLIFWLPPGFHYDTSRADGDTNYQSLMSQFFTDLSGTSYYNILTQYPSPCGSTGATTQSCFGDVQVTSLGVDTSAYTQFNAADDGSAAHPLQDSDIQQEVLKVSQVNSITPDLDSEFFVFTGRGVQECVPSMNCTDAGSVMFCAYHSSTATSAGKTVLYAFMPAVNALLGCRSVSTSPNNQVAADDEIEVMSHEFFESVSDPQGSGWFNDDLANLGMPSEIGDLCNFQTGSVRSDGSNVTLNGNHYLVQEQWSNDDADCVLQSSTNLAGPTIQFKLTTADDDLRGNSSLTAQLATQDLATFESLTLKTADQTSWESSSVRSRVFHYFSAPTATPLAEATLELTSHDGPFQRNDHWNLSVVHITLRNADGTTTCENDTRSPNGSLTLLATLTDGVPFAMTTPECLPQPAAQGEQIACSVFGDSYENPSPQSPSGAVFINGHTQACLPGNGTSGNCARWFGRCSTVTTASPVTFHVFDDGYTNESQSTKDAVYINSSGQACLPDGSATGLCRKWFGRGTTGDGRSVSCTVFDDQNSDPGFASDAIYVNKGLGWQSCEPNGGSTGLCRKWFGLCTAQPGSPASASSGGSSSTGSGKNNSHVVSCSPNQHCCESNNAGQCTQCLSNSQECR
jgi:hypothetical protein